MVNINFGFNRERTVAVVDIAPGGASVAICSVPHSGPSTIHALASSALALEERSEAQEKGLIAAQIKEAGERAQKLYAAAGHKAPITEAVILVHAPWARSSTSSSSAMYEKPLRMDDAHIAALAREALSKNTDIDKGTLMEATVVRIDINGYPTPDPAGVSATSAAVVSLASDCDSEVRAATEGAVHQIFPVAEIRWRSAIRALISLANETHMNEDFLVIDMGDDDTHIASCSQGVLKQVVIPEGVRTILARVAGGRSSEEVLGYIRMIARDACATEACEAVKQALATAEPDLVRIFGEAIAKIASPQRVPNGLLLSAHPELEEWLTVFFTRIDFAQFTVTSLPLSVYTPSTLDIGKWVDGAHAYDPVTVGVALVNIESRS